MWFHADNTAQCSLKLPHALTYLYNSLASACSGGGSLFLLLIVDELEVVLWDVLILFQEELFHLVTDITLDNNLLPSAGDLCDRRTGRELLAEIFGDL